MLETGGSGNGVRWDANHHRMAACDNHTVTHSNYCLGVTHAVVGHVQEMLERFQQSFELRLLQMEAQVPRESLKSPLRDPVPSEDRITEFSSQEDSEANDTVKLASVVRALSPGIAISWWFSKMVT